MSAINRREFLHATAAAGVATAAWSAARADEAPSNRVRVAVMGTNGRGTALAQVFAGLPGSEVAYICDVDDQAIGKAMTAVASIQSQAPQTAKDFRKVLDDPTVDALVVAAPDHWHGPATILACAAKKHVYCEKPCCHNPREGELMVQAARTHDRVVQIGTQRRSSKGVAEAMQKLHEGRIGRVLFARGWINSTRPNIGHGKPAPVPANLDYDLWQGPAPRKDYVDNLIHYNWHWFWHWGTGELGNNGIHALDVCRWGLNVDYPQQVTCSGGKFHFDDDQETPDTQIATFHFGDKAINWEHRTWHPRGFEGEGFGTVFYGEQGTLVMTGSTSAFYDLKGKELEQAPFNSGESEHQANFVECVRSGARPNADVEIGVKSTLLCHLGNIAYRSGHTLNLDPQTRHIVGDEQAAALWAREYQQGWEPVV